MEEFQIQSIKEDDFLAIAETALKCPPMATERNSIYHIFAKFFNNTSLIVKTKDDTIVGFILGFISQINPQDAYIHLLCVIPSYRKNGLARALLREFLDIVTRKGCSRVYLITGPKNNVAIAFYKSMGFKPAVKGDKIEINGIDAVKDYNGPGDHKVVFCKSLK